MSRIVIVILIYHRYKPINSINLLGSSSSSSYFSSSSSLLCGTDKPIDLIYIICRDLVFNKPYLNN
jgi:hypothetical protein